MTVGEYIQTARTERGLTQTELGEKCHVSGAEISRVESGKRRAPSPKMLKAIAKALVIDYAQLMQLAGYIEEVHEEVKEMFQKDATWANVAYRVCSELPDADREILTGLAMTYLEKRRKEIQAENEKK